MAFQLGASSLRHNSLLRIRRSRLDSSTLTIQVFGLEVALGFMRFQLFYYSIKVLNCGCGFVVFFDIPGRLWTNVANAATIALTLQLKL